MSGCFDFTCAHCGGKIRWAGILDDNPPCPRCGEYLSADTIDQAKVLLEQVETEATEERATAIMNANNNDTVCPERLGSPFQGANGRNLDIGALDSLTIEGEAAEEPAFPALVELSSEEADYECSGQAIGSDFREEMPWLQYPGGDYDHDTLELEEE